MVIARDQITLSWQLDVQGTVYYYKKQSSTATAPEKPTSYPPTGWTTTEPGYSSGDTSTLYVTVCTLYDNGSFEYSDVSVSASFEAAKEAYNKAVAAQTAASNAITAANGKTKIFYQDDAPTAGMAVGDMWFDTDGGNAVYQYTATGWVLRQFGNGSIAAGSITANEIAANTITANKIAAKTITGAQIAGTTLSAIFADIGTITAGVLRSYDYSYSSGNYTTEGMIIDLNNKIIRTPKTAILDDGSLYATNGNFSGTISASTGNIGGWIIDGTLNRIYSPVTIGTKTYRANMQSLGSSTDTGKLAFYVAIDEGSTSTYPFRVNYAGKMWAEDAVISGSVTATSGSIGGWDIGTDAISKVTSDGYYRVRLQAPATATTSNYAFRIDQLENNDWTNLLALTYAGQVIATKGTIAGWSLSKTAFYRTNSTFGSSTGMYFGTDGLSLTDKFRVNSSGTVYIENGIKVTEESERFIEFYTSSLASGSPSPIGYVGSFHGSIGTMFYSENEAWLRSKNNQVIISANYAMATSVAARYDASAIILGAGTVVAVGHLEALSDLVFTATTDTGIIKGYNGMTAYNILRNHGNGNVSLSACGVGVYIGYENTTLINFNNGKVTIPNNGDLNVTVGNIYVGQTSDTTYHAVIARNSLGNAQLHVGASGNHGLYSGTKGNWIIYCNPDANSTNSWAYVPRPLYVTGNFVSTAEVHAGGKGTASDGKTGSILSTAGHLYMQGASGSHIYFYYGTSTSVTSQLYESASGTLTASANLNTTGNLTVSTTSTSVDRTVTVANGNASGSVRAASGGAFGLYVTKTGGVTRTAVYLTAMDSNGTYRTNWNPSDRRVKNIIGDMPDSEAETLLRRLKIYNFRYKTDATKTVQNGMIAQQVRDVLSECGYGYRLYLDIRSADGEDFLYSLNSPEQDVQYGIDYARMTPILWKGWQIHDGKILNHEDRIATLERENNRLKKEIALLKGDVA